MSRILIFLLIVCVSCSSGDDSSPTSDDVVEVPTDDDPMVEELYFPPLTSEVWETTTVADLGWDQTALDELDVYLEETNTSAFIILKNGRIVVENYYNNTDATTTHRWYSAAKTLVATTVGIAEEQSFLTIEDPSSDHLGEQWTAMTATQENAITIRNQLTMTSGGDFTVSNLNCTDPECLIFLEEAGTNWYYHNGFYTLLQDVVSSATNLDFDTYFNEQLQSNIGMNGSWFQLGFSNLFISDARDMARFGLLALNNGNWDGNQIVNTSYFTEMTTPSQELNNAYGYLWWLNGQEDFKLPGSTDTFPGSLIPTAPDDLFAGLGLNDQKMYVVPSEELVVIRLGDDASGESVLGPSSYDAELWERIMEVID